MPNHRVRNIDTFPTIQPEFPAEIHIFTVHEEYPLIELAHPFESFPSNEHGGSRTPCRFTGGGIVCLGMFSGCLPSFAHTDRGILFRTSEQSLETSRFEFGIGIQQKHEFRGALCRQ